MDSFLSKHRQNMTEAFGENWKNEDKLFQYVFETAYGGLSAEFSELEANIGDGAPALVYMNDGRVLKGEATYNDDATINVSSPRLESETIDLRDVVMLFVKGDKDYLPTRDTPQRQNNRALDEDAVIYVEVQHCNDSKAEKGFSAMCCYPEEEDVWDLEGQRIIVIDKDNNLYKGEGYGEICSWSTKYGQSRYRVTDPAILIHTGEGNNFREIKLKDVKELVQAVNVDYASGHRVKDNEDICKFATEKLLQYRPLSKDEAIPYEVYETRCCIDSGVGDLIDKLCAKDKNFRAMFFGYKEKDVSDERASANLLIDIASRVNDVSSCEKIFKSSAWGDRMSDDAVKQMAQKAVDFVKSEGEKNSSRKSPSQNTEKPSKTDGQEK